MEVFVQDCNTLIVRMVKYGYNDDHQEWNQTITAQATIRLMDRSETWRDETDREFTRTWLEYNVYGWYLDEKGYERMGNLSPDKCGYNHMFLRGALGGAMAFVALKGGMVREAVSAWM